MPWTKASCIWSQPKNEIFEKVCDKLTWLFLHVLLLKMYLEFYILNTYILKKYLLQPQNVLDQNVFCGCPHWFLICSLLVTEIQLIFNLCHIQSKAILMGIFGTSPHILFSFYKMLFNHNLLFQKIISDLINSFSRQKYIYFWKPISIA